MQAEHGPDSQVVLVAVGDEVDTVGLGQEVERQCRELPRDSIATKALSHSYIVIVKDMAEVRYMPLVISSSCIHPDWKRKTVQLRHICGNLVMQLRY